MPAASWPSRAICPSSTAIRARSEATLAAYGAGSTSWSSHSPPPVPKMSECVPVTHSDIFGTGGGLWLDQLVLPAPYAAKVASLRALIAVLDGQIARLGQEAAGMLAGDKGYAAVRELDGIGPVLAAVICAEIGDVTRFGKAGQLCSWAGLTPRHHESDTKVIRGHCSKQGSRMLRWALAEAVSVSDFLCAGLFSVRYRMFIRCPLFALSDAVVPVLSSGLAESDLLLLSRADAACPGFRGVCCCPGRLLPDPPGIA